MTEEEIIGRLRQIEQMARCGSSAPYIELRRDGGGSQWEITLLWRYGDRHFYKARIADVFDAVEKYLGSVAYDRAAIDAYIRAEESVAPGVQDALLRLRSAVFAPAITGCPRMTIDEFLERLSKTPRDWDIVAGAIRRGPFGTCPINEVAGREGARWPLKFGLEMGLRDSDACLIINGADSRRGKLRARILAACGLEENKHA